MCGEKEEGWARGAGHTPREERSSAARKEQRGAVWPRLMSERGKGWLALCWGARLGASVGVFSLGRGWCVETRPPALNEVFSPMSTLARLGCAVEPID